MSRPVKEMLVREYRSRLGQVREAMLVSIRGIGANDATKIRADLRQQDMCVTVVRNTLARRALEGTPLEPLTSLLVGPSAVAFGGPSVVEVARRFVELARQYPTIELKGAVLDGQLFEGEAGVRTLSQFPTRQEAICRLAGALLGPGRQLATAAVGPGARLAALVKAIREKLEGGEAIGRAA